MNDNELLTLFTSKCLETIYLCVWSLSKTVDRGIDFEGIKSYLFSLLGSTVRIRITPVNRFCYILNRFCLDDSMRLG